MKHRIKILLGLVVIVGISVLYAAQATHFTRIRVSADPATVTNDPLSDGQIEIEGTIYALSGVDAVGGYVSTTANTFVGDQSIDGDLDFLGAQEISTTAGSLTIAPFDGATLITGGLTTTTANTFVGDQSIDGDLNFLGAQAITTTTGALTLNPAENFDVVIATSDTLTAGPITVFSNYVLEGYSTGRSVIRVMDVLVTNASTGGLLQLETTDVFNGDVNAAEDDLTLDTPGTAFTYGDGAGADDNKVTILDAGISGVPVAVLSSEVVSNAGGTDYTVNGVVVGTGIELVWLGITDAVTTADLDLLVDTGIITVRVVYITTL